MEPGPRVTSPFVEMDSFQTVAVLELGGCRMYPLGYTDAAKGIRQTPEFATWLNGLKDRQARVRIQTRIYRLSLGLPGDVKPIREGVSEMRIDYGPGYRIYFCRKGETLTFLLAGGDKSTQQKDIRTALELAHRL